MSTRVVHCKKERYDVYIGRACRGIKNEGWGNPFIIGKDGDRAEVIAKYRQWLMGRPELIERARRELRGKTLSCWCKGTDGDRDVPCHGDVLAEVADTQAP